MPYFGSAVLGAQALMALGATDSTTEILGGIASGATIAALCWADAAGRWRTEGSDVVASADSQTLTGQSTLVVDGPRADILLVLAHSSDETIKLFAADPLAVGVTIDEHAAVDVTLSLATVKFDAARARLLGTLSPADLQSLLNIATTATTALQVGVAQRGLDMTVAYSKTREQFGRPIGSFQALKHRMADVHVMVEAARSVSLAAAHRVSTRGEDTSHWAATAKSWCTDAANLSAAETIQIHGGIAITWEHDAHVVFKLAHSLAHMFGGAREHQKNLAASLAIADEMEPPIRE